MGRRSINTTKSGKFMNPTDQARKEARKKELKKNKKQRLMVRHAVLKGKDPTRIFVELEDIDKMEYDTQAPSALSEKVLKEKRRKLKETLERVLKLYEKEDPEYGSELKKMEVEYEKKRMAKQIYFEQVKNAERVQLDQIPLPEAPSDMASLPLPGDIPLPMPQPKSILKKNAQSSTTGPTVPAPTLHPAGPPPGPPPDLSDSEEEPMDTSQPTEEVLVEHSDLQKAATQAEEAAKQRKIRFADDDAVDADAEEKDTRLTIKSQSQQRDKDAAVERKRQEREERREKRRLKRERWEEKMAERRERRARREEARQEREARREAKKKKKKSVEAPTPLQIMMLKMAGQQLPEGVTLSDSESEPEQESEEEKSSESESESEIEPSSSSSSSSEDEGEEEERKPEEPTAGAASTLNVPKPSTAAPLMSPGLTSAPPGLPPGPPPGLPPMMFRAPPIRGLGGGPPRMLPPGPPPGRPPGIPPGPPPGLPPHLRAPPPRMPPGPPPGMPPLRLMRPPGMPPGMVPPGMGPGPDLNPSVLSAPPSIMKPPLKSDEETTKSSATIEAKPQIKHSIGDVTRFMPTSLKVKRTVKDARGRIVKHGKEEETPTVGPAPRPTPSVPGKTKDDAYDAFMKEMEGLL